MLQFAVMCSQGVWPLCTDQCWEIVLGYWWFLPVACGSDGGVEVSISLACCRAVIDGYLLFWKQLLTQLFILQTRCHLVPHND
jgi:hypothetical protein